MTETNGNGETSKSNTHDDWGVPLSKKKTDEWDSAPKSDWRDNENTKPPRRFSDRPPREDDGRRNEWTGGRGGGEYGGRENGNREEWRGRNENFRGNNRYQRDEGPRKDEGYRGPSSYRDDNDRYRDRGPRDSREGGDGYRGPGNFRDNDGYRGPSGYREGGDGYRSYDRQRSGGFGGREEWDDDKRRGSGFEDNIRAQYRNARRNEDDDLDGERRREFKPRPRRDYGRKPDPCNVLGLFGLSLYATDTDIKDFLNENIPDIKYLSFRIVSNRLTGNSRGFAFVYFSTVDEATLALEALNDKPLINKIVRVEYSISEGNKSENKTSNFE